MEPGLDDRFELLRELGAGGMGVVYEARDRERDILVALKTLRRADASLLRHLKREFRALANVRHPNLVELHELFVERDQAFFTMELVAGVPFLDWTAPGLDPAAESPSQAGTVREPAAGTGRRRATDPALRASPCDYQRLRPALRQLAEGVSALHASGMLHRDLKSSNVLVQPDGRVVILDFGLATEVSAGLEGGEGLFAGTPDYMSPEQAARKPFGVAADWYAIGVLLYRALAGRLPFLGGQVDVLMDKQRFEPPPPHQVATGVPEDLGVLCSELLRRDPRARPPGREVLRRLGSTADGAAGTPSSSSGIDRSVSSQRTFVGRERQLAVFERALEAAGRQESVVVELSGTSGMGKTALAQQLVAAASRIEGAIVLQGRCYERETVAYKAFDSLVDALCAYLASLPAAACESLVPRDATALARLFPVLRQIEVIAAAPGRTLEGIEAQELRRRAFRALRELLSRIGDRRQLVLVLDDLQWGDVDSAALLGALLRPPDPPPLLLVLGYRSDERATSPFLQRLDDELATAEPRRFQVEVGPLDPAEAARLAIALLDSAGGGATPAILGRAERIAAETGGNPLFIVQMVRHVLDHPGEEVDLVSLDRLLRERLERLPEEESRLLRVIALVGRPLPLELALRAAEVSHPDAAALLRAGNLVRFHGPRRATLVECYHDRIREAQTRMLDAEAERALHLRIARTLSTSPEPDAEELAVHFRAAGELERAAELSVRAAERAREALAFERAARLYEQAVATLGEAGGAVPRELLVQLGDALASAGRGAPAAQRYLEAVPGAGTAEALDLQRRAATQLLCAGHLDEGMGALRRVLDAVGLRLREAPGPAVAALLWHRARLRLRGLDFRPRDASELPANELVQIDLAYSVAAGLGMVNALAATEFLTRHLLRTLRAGEPLRVLHALAAEVCLSSAEGVRVAARTARVVARLDALAAALDGPAIRPLVLASTGVVAFNEGRWLDCLERSTEAETLFRERCAGYVWECTTAQIFRLFSLVMLGRLGELGLAYEAVEQAAVERGDLYAQTNLRTAVRSQVFLRDGEPDEALGALEDAFARWPVRYDQLQGLNATTGEVLSRLYLGDARRAYEVITSRWRTFERAFLLRVQTLRTVSLCNRVRPTLALAAERRDEALVRAAEADARRLLREGVAYAACEGQLAMAGVARLRGQDERELAALEALERTAESIGAFLYVALSRRWRGRLVGGTAGRALVEASEVWGLAEKVVALDRLLGAYAPVMPR